jgi:AraC-like DNA-binding protein
LGKRAIEKNNEIFNNSVLLAMGSIYGNEKKDRLTGLLSPEKQKSMEFLLSEMRFIVLNVSYWHSFPPWNVDERSIFDNLILIVEEGSLEICVNGETRRADPGDCVFISEMTSHAYRLNEGCKASSQFILHALPLSPVCSDPFGMLDCCFLKLKHKEAVFDMFRRAIAMRNHSDPSALSYAGTIIQHILMEAVEEGHFKPGKNMLSHSRIATAYDFIADNYARNISIVDVADSVNLKESQFRRIFKRETGFTPNAYLHRIRLQNSVRVLMRHNLPLKDVAGQSGFNSVTYFCTSFLRFFKMTPENFRKKWGA